MAKQILKQGERYIISNETGRTCTASLTLETLQYLLVTLETDKRDPKNTLSTKCSVISNEVMWTWKQLR